MPFNPSTGYYGISVEATAGTAVTTPDLFYPMQEVDFDFQDEIIRWQEIRGSRQAQQAQDGPLRPSVTMSGAVYPSGAMGMLLRAAIGEVESALESPSTTVYKHDFVAVDASVLPSLTVERSTGFGDDSNSPFAQRIGGCKVESFGFDMSFGEQVKFNSTLQATNAPETITAVNRASVTQPTVAPLYFGGATVAVDGTPTALFKSLSLAINNTLERQETLNGTRTSHSIFEGGVEVTLSGTMEFTDDTYYGYLLNGTEIDAVVKCDNKEFADQPNSLKYALEFTLPRLRLTRHSIPFTAGQTIEADVEFAVLFDPTDECMIIPSLYNIDDGTDYS